VKTIPFSEVLAEALADPAVRAEYNRLTVASVIDHPSVYMGGPSEHALRLADRILAAIKYDTLVAENERLREALLYYADRHNYEHGDVPGHIYVLSDAGDYARDALGDNK
jgi:hypothetical protein